MDRTFVKFSFLNINLSHGRAQLFYRPAKRLRKFSNSYNCTVAVSIAGVNGWANCHVGVAAGPTSDSTGGAVLLAQL